MKIYVVGGGPAGVLAAAQASYNGHDVTLIEKNEKLFKKLFITGKGRCNVTNACDIEDFFENISRNSSFCYSAIYTFTPENVMDLIANNGTPLKTERGQRVFPVSDKSSDIIKAFEKYLKNSGAKILLNTKFEDVIVNENKVAGIKYNGRVYPCDKVILALGGASYVSTGSDGLWKNKIENLGHKVEDFIPSLIPFTTSKQWVKDLQGLSLKNVTLKAEYNGRLLYQELGEMLFTHFGISGPLVLTLSSKLKQYDFSKLKITVDLKPGLTFDQLDQRILRDFKEAGNKTLKNAMVKLLPSRLISAVLLNSQVDENKCINQLKQEERQKIVKTLKGLNISVDGLRPINEAIITRGGVNVKEINPSTMESKIINNLFFAGEMIDIDAVTGGFNIQLALSTGYLAGMNI
ncbi:MAG: NAD(P)/FAD-dependent oxidoreductase [Clostridiales bacterium]|nr:NAD(P)/FAD-dependent oxidoreductase [Clostridiales bacterium]